MGKLSPHVEDLKKRSPTIKYINISLQIWKAFSANNGPLWATSLTYTTLLAIVPLLAVALALFKAFGGFEQAQETYFFPLINEMLDPTHKIEVMGYIQKFVNNIDVGVLGIVGTLIFLLTFIPLFISMERAINAIWARVDDRPIWLKFAIYWAITTLGPMVIVVSMVVLSMLSSYVPGLEYLKTMKPFVLLLIILSLFFIYKLVPNTDVWNKPAFIGASAGGVLWIMASLLYQTYMKYTTTTITIYGSLGAIPIFLLWIYLNWFIILLGAQVARYAQYPQKKHLTCTANSADLFRASIDILKTLSTHIATGAYLTEARLSRITHYPPEILSKVIESLGASGLILIKGDLLLPTKSLSAIRPADLVQIFIGNIKDGAFKGLPVDVNGLDNVTLADIT